MQDRMPSRPSFDVTAIDLGGDIVIVTDAEGIILDVNAAFVRSTGFSRQEALGQTPRLLKSGVQDPALYEQLWSTVRRGNVWSGELVDRHRDGSLRTYQSTLTPIVGPDGQVTHVVAVQRDLSTDLARHARVDGIGALHTDPAGRCIYVDGEGARMLGATPPELFASGWRAKLVREDVAAVLEAVETSIATGREQRLDVRTATGRWLRLQIAPLRASDGTNLGTSWHLENVTDLVDLHADVEEREARVNALLDAHVDPVAIVDQAGTVVATNPAWIAADPLQHPALGFDRWDDLLTGLRRLAEQGDVEAELAAADLAELLTGVPATGRTGSQLVFTPLASEHGGAVVRWPATRADTHAPHHTDNEGAGEDSSSVGPTTDRRRGAGPEDPGA